MPSMKYTMRIISCGSTSFGCGVRVYCFLYGGNVIFSGSMYVIGLRNSGSVF